MNELNPLRLNPLRLYCAIVVLLLNVLMVRVAPADDENPCAKIQDSIERLECYDQQANTTFTKETAVNTDEGESPLRKRIDIEKKLSKLGEFVIVPHRPTYLLPLTHMSRFNVEPFRDAFGDEADLIQKYEAKFQISFKVPLWLDIGHRDIGLWFGYTQLALWQLYNSDISSPFRETNYEPEIILSIANDHKLLGMKNTFIHLGLNHQSNGQSGPLSRSWNRFYANFILERNSLVLSFKPWYRIPDGIGDDDNPDIDEFLGYGELSFYYTKRRRIWGMRLWNNFRSSDNHTSVQLDWSFPMATGLKGYVQYFNGYGETLVDYNYRIKRIGLGIMLTDWF